MLFRKLSLCFLTVCAFFCTCSRGDIRAFLEDFQPYVDGTYDPDAVSFSRTPVEDQIDVFPFFSGHFTGQYRVVLYGSTGKFIEEQFSSSDSPHCLFTGLAPGADYSITLAPWNEDYFIEGIVRRFVFTQGYSYADPTAPAGGDGLIWQTAKRNLQDAISMANDPLMLGVRAAIGTYVPSTDPSGLGSGAAEYNHFQLIAGHTIEGGWDPSTNQRTGMSTASGDQGGGVNSYHVFYRPSSPAELASLRHFNVTGGTADGVGASDARGGGLWSLGNTQIEYCEFYGNAASGYGGAIYYDGSILMRVNRSTFKNNIAGISGGAIYTGINSQVLLESDVFYQNQADEGYSVSTENQLIIRNSVFYQDFSILSRTQNCNSCLFSRDTIWIDNSTFVTKGVGNHVFIKGVSVASTIYHWYTMSIFFEIDPVDPAHQSNSIHSMSNCVVAYENVFGNILQGDMADPVVNPISVTSGAFKNISNPLAAGDWFDKNCGLMPTQNSVLRNAGVSTLTNDIRGLPHENPACAGAYEYEQ